MSNDTDTTKVGANEFVDPHPTPRLSRRNIIALILTIAGVLLVLFFSSRRTLEEPVVSSESGYMGHAPIEINLDPTVPSDPDPWGAPSSGNTNPSREEMPREKLRLAHYEEALRSTPVVVSTQETDTPVQDTAFADAPPHNSRQVIGEYTVAEGATIEAVLVTGAQSNRPGPVTARIVQPVYDSMHLQHLLIPAGTRLMGFMEHAMEGQDRRVILAWTRMIFPDGRFLNLPGLPALDTGGEAGLRGTVRTHRAQAFGSAALIALLGASTTYATSQLGSAGSITGATLALELSRTATSMLERGLNRKPTVSVRAGYRFLVYVSQDMVFDGPYR